MRGSDSQKSPYLVKVSDLANYLDSRYSVYRKDWDTMKGR